MYQTRPGSLTNGEGAEWRYVTSDTTGTVFGTGYFQGCMRNSRGSNALGVSTGDSVFILHGTSALTCGIFTGSTANQASTTASTGWNAAYDGSITSLTAL
jgi:hypothetical protein